MGTATIFTAMAEPCSRCDRKSRELETLAKSTGVLTAGQRDTSIAKAPGHGQIIK